MRRQCGGRFVCATRNGCLWGSPIQDFVPLAELCWWWFQCPGGWYSAVFVTMWRRAISVSTLLLLLRQARQLHGMGPLLTRLLMLQMELHFIQAA